MSDDKIFKYIEANKEDKQSNSGNTATIAVLDKPKTKKPPLYRVIVLNDDYTPMEFVIYVLQSFFGLDKEKATQVMLSVHTKGKGICGIFTREVAETKSMHINNFAQQNEHPLISEIEPAEED